MFKNMVMQSRRCWQVVIRAVNVAGLMVVGGGAFSQPPTAQLSAYFDEVRAGKYGAIPKTLFQPENAKATLLQLARYLHDSAAAVRSKAYVIAQLAGSTARGDHLRAQAVSMLVGGINDNDDGNVGQVLGYLTGFKRDDFPGPAKDTLVSLFKRRPSHYEQLILMVGFLELKELQPDLRSLAQHTDASGKERWAALLALSRMDDPYAIDNVLNRAKKLPPYDEVVYEIFPDLLYTRQRRIVDLLVAVLHSDEKNCEPANASSGDKIACAYRVMEMLAPAIVNFPLALDASGDIDTTDYAASLQTVRRWFLNNKNYTLNKSNY